jgi:hypothetical protein
METKHKTLYETPEVEVVSIRIASCILSGPNGAKREDYVYFDLDDNS